VPVETTDTLPRVFTVAQVQQALKISRGSAYDLCASGRLKSFKVGASVRVSEAELIRFMNSAAVPGRTGAEGQDASNGTE
jgi:excisionase family DNA binding protein